MSQETYLYIRRNAQSKHLEPESVAKNPGQALMDLLDGYVYAWPNPRIDTYPLNSRGSYGIRSNTHQQGDYSYSLLLCLPLSADELKCVSFCPNTGNSQTYIPLTQIQPGEYSHFFAPCFVATQILPAFTAIYGGKTESTLPLKPLYIGNHAEKVINKTRSLTAA